MTESERALLLAMARVLLTGGDKESLRDAIAWVERDKRCVFDGNSLPCPHHSGSPLNPTFKDYWK